MLNDGILPSFHCSRSFVPLPFSPDASRLLGLLGHHILNPSPCSREPERSVDDEHPVLAPRVVIVGHVSSSLEVANDVPVQLGDGHALHVHYDDETWEGFVVGAVGDLERLSNLGAEDVGEVLEGRSEARSEARRSGC